ncbi:MAG: 5'/3'-nucleotidase SurE [Gammaproteobacteria bacterium]|nr:5'/3'-nucleotidase SurE [Gammaproteobacteria bacterium]
MRFLISNDDGYQAQGIEMLAAAMARLGEVNVVAPDRNRSGASNSLTLDSPLYVNTARNGFYYVNGTPTDCVHLAITGLFDEEPDLVISGVNSGANLGDDVLYSGTVAAAMEARFLGCPALAVSLAGDSPLNFESAVRVVSNIVALIANKSLASDLLLNVNVPDVNYEKIAGYEVTRLGYRHKAEPAIKMRDPKNQEIYWIGPPGAGDDAGEGTDFYAVEQNKVSITPLQTDLTRYNAVEAVKEWVSAISDE